MTIGERIEVAFLAIGVGGGALLSIIAAARWLFAMGAGLL